MLYISHLANFLLQKGGVLTKSGEALLGNHFWSRGYFVNTIGLNEDIIRRYVRSQEEEDKKEENNGKQFSLFD